MNTPVIEWGDLNTSTPFEILLARWGNVSRTGSIRSTALCRPLDDEGAPWLSLGGAQIDGPRVFKGRGRTLSDDTLLRRHLPRLLPLLLKRRLWGRVLWLDESLDFHRQNPDVSWEEDATWRLYLGASGIGQWCLIGDPRHFSLHAGFEWPASDAPHLLARSSDEELRALVLDQVRDKESDIAFAREWANWGWNSQAWQRRRLMVMQAKRDSPELLRTVLDWALACEPEFSSVEGLSWTVDPCTGPSLFYGEPEEWREPLELDWSRDEHLYASEPGRHLRLPPFLRRLRDWAGEWFGAELNEELRSLHRCTKITLGTPTLRIERDEVPSAHEQIEALARLREFLAARITPGEAARLLGM